MKLTSTSRQVLRNLYNGEPMWKGVIEMVPGSGNPAIENSLRKRGLINRSKQLTDAGKALVEKGLKP